jgi:hypothetical protein
VRGRISEAHSLLTILLLLCSFLAVSWTKDDEFGWFAVTSLVASFAIIVLYVVIAHKRKQSMGLSEMVPVTPKAESDPGGRAQVSGHTMSAPRSNAHLWR